MARLDSLPPRGPPMGWKSRDYAPLLKAVHTAHSQVLLAAPTSCSLRLLMVLGSARPLVGSPGPSPRFCK